MMKYSRLTVSSLAIATLTLTACKGDAAKADLSKSDSALAANLMMANRDSAAKPRLTDTAMAAPTKAPAAKTTKATAKPKAATKPAAPKMGSIAAGTSITLASGAKICTNTNAVGDNVTATTSESVGGSNSVAIPAGATVNMTVTQLKRSENVNDKIVMEFRVVSIAFGGKTYPVEASVAEADVTKIRDEPKGKDVQKVAIGAAAGAVAGKLIGKSNKGAVIGGAAGAAAGAGVAVATANYQGCINEGAKIVVKLDAPLELATGTKP